MEQLRIVLAGAGAGKTHNLKNDVLECLPLLEPCFYCAVITFTNAATEELRTRLSQSIRIPSNLFIGTIHSFFVQFVLEPYGKLLNLLPEDKIYVDRVTSRWAEKDLRIQKANEYESKGILVYDKIFEISEKILQKQNIFELFINRIKFLFIDEYQDVRLRTHKIWERIIEAKRTKVYVIGDPLQHIFGFTYNTTHLDPEEQLVDFSDTPLKSFVKNHYDKVSNLNDNWRSSKNIVDLTNNFIIDEASKQISHRENSIPIYYLNQAIPEKILEEYFRLKQYHEITSIHNKNLEVTQKPFFEDLYLTRNWIDADWANGKLPLLHNSLKSIATHLEKGESVQTTFLQELVRNILGIAKLKKSDFIKDIHDELYFRTMCFDLIGEFRDKDYNHCKAAIKKHFKQYFDLELDFSSGELDQKTSLNNLLVKKSKKNDSYFSTIFSCKGLEASSVLVFASNNRELKEWLDFNKANSELDDKYRLGYVAFSRAREMLCIANFEQADQELLDKFRQFNFKIIE